jgi:2-desacetyl-2-hydroxyethyl bacteriochlorophyllide A dehydrogenase
MNALVCVQPGLFEYKDLSVPALQENHALIKIKRVGICGTDLHAFAGNQPYFNYPRILGHELSGDLIAADGDIDFDAGEAITFLPYFNCGICIACRNGKPNCCANLKVCGVHIDGGMVDYLLVPSASLIKSKGLGYDELALAEPLAIGAHAVRRANIKPTEIALVIGAGPIGLGIMQFAKIAGATVIAMDVNASRLEFCSSKLKIPHIINSSTEDSLARLKEITNNDMPVAVFDATGNLDAINNAFQLIAHGGRYILVGLQKGNISFSHPEFHKREATLMSSRNATKGDFEYVIDSIKNRSVNPSIYITHRTTFNNVKEEFPQWLKPENGVIKAMVSLE